MIEYRVKLDWETIRFKFKPRFILFPNPKRPAYKPPKGTPAVFPVSNLDSWPTTTFCNYPARWQWYTIDLLALSKYGVYYDFLHKKEKAFILRAFKGLTGSINAFNNGKGTDKFRCYPCDKGSANARKADPKWESLICGNNFVYGLETKVNKKGREMVRLHSFLESDFPPIANLNDPRVQVATIVKRNRTVTNFPQLKGAKVYFPFLTKGVVWYPLDELELYEPVQN